MPTRDQILSEASELIDAAKPEKAVDILEQYLAKAPADAEALAMIGVAHYNNCEPWEAEKYFKQSLAIIPDQDEIKRLLLRLLMDRHAWEEALEIATELKRDNPSDAVLRVMYESCFENVERPEVGWERDESLGWHRIEFTEGGPK